MIMGVPYDAEIAYLESTGEQWIDTGIYADNRYTISFKIEDKPLTNKGTYGLFGEYVGSGGKLCYMSIDKQTSNRFSGGWDGYTFGAWSVQSWGGNTYEFVMNRNKSMVNGSLWASYSSTVINESGYTMLIFNVNNTWFEKSRVKLHYFKIEMDSKPIIDLIPVRVGNVGYMYDRVTRKLFGNKGTGAFVLGPDVAKPVMGLRKFTPTARNYVQDGLVAMWDGIENAG